jgi:hypothetical protein
LLGIRHEAFFPHPTGRPLHVTEGEPLYPILGDVPATDRRMPPGGNLALVPVFDDALLLNPGFEEAQPLIPIGSGTRLKGWQALPVSAPGKGATKRPALSVRLMTGEGALPHSGRQHAALGYGLSGMEGTAKICQAARAILTQEVRNPRAGRYTFSAHASGGAVSEEVYRNAFLKHFSCRLVIFGYKDLKKDPRNVREFASAVFRPPFADGHKGGYSKFEVAATLRSQDGGAMEIERGVGVAVVVEKSSPDELDPVKALSGKPAFIRIDDVDLRFVPRPRNDDKQD